MPLLKDLEPEFSGLYGNSGRPNYSVGRILGICLLQEMNDLSDQAALDSLAFDSRWQHALDATEERAYLSRRSLVEFRRRLGDGAAMGTGGGQDAMESDGVEPRRRC